MPTTKSVQEMQDHFSPELDSLRAENTELKSLLKEQKRLTGDVSEIVRQIREAAKQAEPAKLLYAKPKEEASKTPCSLVVHLTDLHIGLQVDKEATEEFGEFNYALAVSRMDTLLKKVLDWTALNRHSYAINEAVVLGTGDWCSGDINESLIRTNEFAAPVQAVKSGYLVGSFLNGLSAHFDAVRCEFITQGNHDRLTKKPQTNLGGYNSWGYVVGVVASENVKPNPRIKVNIYPMSEKVVMVQNTRYLIGHGAGIIGTWGIPYYGIDRRKQREAMARMNMPDEKHFDKIVIGHFHSALNHEHWLVGGSLSGTDENDHNAGRHSRPHQTAWFVHNRHHEFDWNRFWL